MKVVRDNEGNKAYTVQSNHGCLKFLGVLLGIGLIIGLLSGQEGIGGILAGIAFIAIMIAGAVVRASKSEDGPSTQENPQPEEVTEHDN